MRRTISPLFKLLTILLLFALPSCGVYEAISILTNSQKPKQKQSGSSRGRINRSPSGEALVTLKPPYTGWTWEDDHDKIGVGNAVSAVCRQAGIGYNQKRSYANTAPLCRQWAHPNFENKPWKDAVAEILAPVNLTYVMEKNEVILMKAEDAAKREQALEHLRTQIAQFLSASNPPLSLPDAVIIFPLLDSDGKTTQLGTLLSELAMLKATYLPEKVLNLHLPAAIDLYEGAGYDEPGTSVTDKQQERIRRRFETKNAASGELELDASGAFKLTLTLDGQHGKKEFSLAGSKEDLYKVPQWMARCIHQYCQTKLSAEQKEYLNLPEIRDTASLDTLVELEHDYLNGRGNLTKWGQLLTFNPDSAFILYRYSLASKGEERDDSLDHIAAAMKALGNHGLLRFVEADWYYRAEKERDYTPRFFELLKEDFRNDELYDRLDDGLLALGLGESAEALHRAWTERSPNSYLALYSGGRFYKNYAWDARGSGFADTVTPEGWKKFGQRLPIAEQNYLKAYDFNPTDPRISTGLIETTIGLGHDPDKMELWFKNAVEADPMYYKAYYSKLRYLTPKWHGDRYGSQMFAFARECAANPPQGSRVALMLSEAHEQMAYEWARSTDRNWRDYYSVNPSAWKELKPVYERYLREHPDSISDRNYCARTAFWSHDYQEAARQFQIIGTDIDRECWSDKYFYECRTKAYAQANGGQSG